MLIREKALQVAQAEIGVKESPAGSNSGPRVNEYLASAGLGPGFPWCMAFVHWCYRQAGLVLDHPNLASVGFFEAWARTNGHLVTVPKRGDIICYRFDGDDWPDHVGIIESVGVSGVVTVEGNTAFGNDANGGMVMQRTRSLSRVKLARIPGTLEKEVTMPAWFEPWFRWYITGRDPATKPAGVPSQIPSWAWSLVKAYEDAHKLNGPPPAFLAWARWYVFDRAAPRPGGVPATIPPPWWAALNDWLAFAKQHGARISADLAKKVADVARLQEELADLQVKLESAPTVGEVQVLRNRIGATRSLLDQAVATLDGET